MRGGERRRPLEFPCYQYAQAKAKYYGFEAEASVKLAQLGGFALNADGLADYVHASVTGSGPAPRIPPLRVLGGLELQSERMSARAEVEHTFDQTRIAPTERRPMASRWSTRAFR